MEQWIARALMAQKRLREALVGLTRQMHSSWAFQDGLETHREEEHAVELINREVARINGRYFKSFVDFVRSGAVEKKRLVATADAVEMVLNPNIEVDSWLRIPFYDLDLGLYLFLLTRIVSDSLLQLRT
jgi:hypothetical protein